MPSPPSITPPPHAELLRIRESGRGFFNTVDVALFATRTTPHASHGVVSLRMTLGNSRQRAPDVAFNDPSWFAIRVQRDAALFDDLLGQLYAGERFSFLGFPAPCAFVSPTRSWISNGHSHERSGEGIWRSPSYRYHAAGTDGPVFDSHDAYSAWTSSVGARSDVHDAKGLIARLALRQPLNQHDHVRQFHLELEYPLYLDRQEFEGDTTHVYFFTPLPASVWNIKWQTDTDGGICSLVDIDGIARLTLSGRHAYVEVIATLAGVPVGPYRSVAPRVSYPAPTDRTPTPTPAPIQDASSGSMQRTKLLFLSANADPSSPLKLEKEQARVSRARNASRHQDRIDIEAHPDLNVVQFEKSMWLLRPALLHFAGHGGPGGSILMRDHNGHPKDMSPTGIARLIRQHKAVIRLVVLNACFSDELSALLVEDIDCVVGIKTAVRDEPAVLFSEVFYGALFDGRNLASAFEVALGTVEAQYDAEVDRPQLRTRTGVDPTSITLIATIPPSTRLPRP